MHIKCKHNPQQIIPCRGTNQDNKIDGTAFRDIIIGQDGNDHIHGGTGKNTLQGGRGNDTYYFEGGMDEIMDSAGEQDCIILPGKLKDYTYSSNGAMLEIYLAGVDVKEANGKNKSRIEIPGFWTSTDTIEYVQDADKRIVALKYCKHSLEETLDKLITPDFI
jgi:Ca2+-binding RTX toxin-like protein